MIKQYARIVFIIMLLGLNFFSPSLISAEYLGVFDSTAGVSVWSGSVGVDSLNYVEGSSSLMITSMGTAQIAYPIAVPANTLKSLDLWVYIYDYSVFNTFSIYVSSFTGFNAYLSSYLSLSVLTPGWNHVVVDASKMSSYNKASPSNAVVRISFKVQSVLGKVCRVSVDALGINVDQAPKIVFTFDDNLLSVYQNAKPVMDQYGYEGVFYIVSSYVGLTPTSKLVSLGQLKEMYASGWDIGGHTVSHADLSRSSVNLENEVNGCHDWLVANNFTRSADQFAYPYGYGFDSPTVVAKVAEHFKTARTVKWGTYQGMTQIPNYGLKGYNVKYTTTQADLKEEVDRAFNQGGLLIFILHGVVTTAPRDYEISLENFRWLCGYVSSRGVDVVTLSGLIGPPLPSPVDHSLTIIFKGGLWGVSDEFGVTSFSGVADLMLYVADKVSTWR